TERLVTSVAPGYEPPNKLKRWVRTRGKWQLMDVRNDVHRATAAVHDGTIKALTTDAPPTAVTLSWWFTTDKNAAIDSKRDARRAHAATGALTAATIIDERAVLPAKRAFGGLPDENDNDDDALDRKPKAPSVYTP